MSKLAELSCSTVCLARMKSGINYRVISKKQFSKKKLIFISLMPIRSQKRLASVPASTRLCRPVSSLSAAFFLKTVLSKRSKSWSRKATERRVRMLLKWTTPLLIKPSRICSKSSYLPRQTVIWRWNLPYLRIPRISWKMWSGPSSKAKAMTYPSASSLRMAHSRWAQPSTKNAISPWKYQNGTQIPAFNATNVLLYVRMQLSAPKFTMPNCWMMHRRPLNRLMQLDGNLKIWNSPSR